MLTAGKWSDVREDEMPAFVWEFTAWLKEYCDKHRIRTQDEWNICFEEIAAEAASRGITIQRNGVIDFRKH